MKIFGVSLSLIVVILVTAIVVKMYGSKIPLLSSVQSM